MKRLHMFDVLTLAVVLYCLAAYFTADHLTSTVLWKLGNACAAAFIGYWIDVSLFVRSDAPVPDGDPLLHIRRAIIVGCTILAVALGL